VVDSSVVWGGTKSGRGRKVDMVNYSPAKVVRLQMWGTWARGRKGVRGQVDIARDRVAPWTHAFRGQFHFNNLKSDVSLFFRVYFYRVDIYGYSIL
jgi:hypothetical protein